MKGFLVICILLLASFLIIPSPTIARKLAHSAENVNGKKDGVILKEDIVDSSNLNKGVYGRGPYMFPKSPCKSPYQRCHKVPPKTKNPCKPYEKCRNIPPSVQP